MTLLEIKTEAATYFQIVPSAFTINGQDLFLTSANHVRRQAELAHDFEFLRKRVDVSVNGVTGGSLTTAIDHTTSAVTTIKTVIDCGLYDQFGNLVPTDWGPQVNNMEMQREQNPRIYPRYPTDVVYLSYPRGLLRFDFSGDSVFRFPVTETASTESYLLGLECYTISSDWTGTVTNPVLAGSPELPGQDGTSFFVIGTYNTKYLFMSWDSTAEDSITPWMLWWDGTHWIESKAGNFQNPTLVNYGTFTSSVDIPIGAYTGHGTVSNNTLTLGSGGASVIDTWTTYGSQYILWATIIYMNHRFKQFVFRTEGNLQPPQALRDEALAAFIEWDTDRYTKFRREYR